jgi:hypothetical protein
MCNNSSEFDKKLNDLHLRQSELEKQVADIEKRTIMNNEVLGPDVVDVSKLSDKEYRKQLRDATSLFKDFIKLAVIGDK